MLCANISLPKGLMSIKKYISQMDCGDKKLATLFKISDISELIENQSNREY